MITLPFIRHSQVEPLQAVISRGSRLRAFVPIVVHPGSGGNRIVLEWLRQDVPCERSQIVWTRMTEPKEKRRSKNSIASNSALLLFENAFDLLTKLRTRADEWEVLLYEEPARQFDDTRFGRLKNKVIGLMHKQGVRLWIISGAQVLSDNALDFVFETWQSCNRAFSVVLLGELSRNQECSDLWASSINRDTELGAYSLPRYELYRIDQQIAHLPFRLPGDPTPLEGSKRIDPDELKTIEDTWDKSEYLTVVMPALLDALEVELASDLNEMQFLQRAWHHAQGNWNHITMFATALNDEILRTGRNSRLIRQTTADAVFWQLLPELMMTQ